MKKLKLLLLTSLIISNSYSFNFLINIFYSMLPQPVRSAFKGEGLQIDQFDYGFGNCNFTSFGYLNSDIKYKSGMNIDENYSFSVPTFYLYGGYIAHVSTPMLTYIYPGWQLETEVGFGGTEYHPEYKKEYRKFFVTGSSGFNWRVYKSNEKDKYNFTLNLGFGYKLHYVLKDILYYNIQVGIKIIPKISLSLEYFNTLQGGGFFLFSTQGFEAKSKEKHLILSSNFLLSKKYLLKFSGMYKNWQLKEFKTPQTEQENNFYGIILSLISK